MSKNCDINSLAKTVMADLEKYTDDVEKGVKESAESLAEEGLKKLKAQTYPDASSEGTNTKPMTRRTWKKYAKSWKVKDMSGNSYAKFVILQNQNNGMYRLTHLLENGHMTRNGGKTRAFKHIAPVNDYVVDRFQKDVEKVIKESGK